MDPKKILYLSRQQVEACSPKLIDLINALEQMFKLKGEGKVEMPPKPGIHTMPDAFIHAMPAFIPDMQSAGMKWISGYPENHKKQLPYITGLLILNDLETGIPLAVMDATYITAVRTGAATAVAARHLAKKNSSTLGLLACGVQGESNLLCLNEIFNLKKVNIFDIDGEKAKSFASKFSDQLNLEIEVCDDPKKAVVDLDIVVTSGPILKEPSPLIDFDWLSPGSFYCPLDFDSYFKGSAFAAAHILLTDDVSQQAYYKKCGYFKTTPDIHADLGDLISGKEPGRKSDDEVAIAINLGLALDDMVMAKMVYDQAVNNKIGTRLDF